MLPNIIHIKLFNKLFKNKREEGTGNDVESS